MVFRIWIISIPLALLGGALRGYDFLNPVSEVLLTAGLIGSLIGLVILKTLGG